MSDYTYTVTMPATELLLRAQAALEREGRDRKINAIKAVRDSYAQDGVVVPGLKEVKDAVDIVCAVDDAKVELARLRQMRKTGLDGLL